MSIGVIGVKVIVIALTLTKSGVQSITSTKTVSEGANFRLFCPWTNGMAEMMWVKKAAYGQNIVATIKIDRRSRKFKTKIENAWKPRTTVGYERSKRNFYLQVKGTKHPRDYGTYVCRVKARSDRAVRRYNVVRPSPKLTLVMTSASTPVGDRLLLTEGVVTVVEALVSGHGAVRYTWLRNNVTIQSGISSRLSLENVTREWTGMVLSCGAETSQKRAMVKTNIVVQYPPQVTSIRVDELADDRSGLRCLVQRGFPSQTRFTWQHIVKNVVVRRLPGANTTYGSWIGVKPKDFYKNGIYACLASNNVGTSRKETVLYKNAIKFINTEKEITAGIRETVSLSVSFVSLSDKFNKPRWIKVTRSKRKIAKIRKTVTRGSEVVSFFGTNVPLQLHTYTLTLERVTVADSGTYSLQVKYPNGGERRMDVTLTVTTNGRKDRTRSTTNGPDSSRTTNGPDHSSSSSISIPVLAGTICGVAVGVIIITVIVVIVLVRSGKTPACCRRLEKQPRNNHFSNSSTPQNGVALNNVGVVSPYENHKQTDSDDGVYEQLKEDYEYPYDRYQKLSKNFDEQSAMNDKRNQKLRPDASHEKPPFGSTSAFAHDAKGTSLGYRNADETNKLDDTVSRPGSETRKPDDDEQHKYFVVEKPDIPYYLEIVDDNDKVPSAPPSDNSYFILESA